MLDCIFGQLPPRQGTAGSTTAAHRLQSESSSAHAEDAASGAQTIQQTEQLFTAHLADSSHTAQNVSEDDQASLHVKFQQEDAGEAMPSRSDEMVGIQADTSWQGTHDLADQPFSLR